MTNEELLNRWNKHSYGNLKKFNLSEIYTIMYVERGEDIDDFLDLFALTSDQLIKSNNDRVNDLLLHVDDLMEETSEVLEHFIVDYVLTDKDEEEFLGARRSTIEELKNIYERVAGTLREVRSECY